MKDYEKDLYKKLSENIGETPELFHYDYFKLEGREPYYIGNRKPLTTEGKLESVGMIADILGKNRLRRLGFNIPVGHITARQAVMLNKAAEELPSESDITGADDIELQEIGSRKALITKSVLKPVGMLADILGKNRLRNLGFDIPRGKVTARQAVMLNKAAEELLSESDITKADDIELQKMAEEASGIISQIKDVQTDTEDLFENPLHKLLGLDKQLRSIRASLKVEVAKKVELEELKSIES